MSLTGLKSRCWQGLSLLEASGGNPCLFQLLEAVPGPFSTFKTISEASAPLFEQMPPSSRGPVIDCIGPTQEVQETLLPLSAAMQFPGLGCNLGDHYLAYHRQ